MKNIVVAIDGPAGTGKSITGKMLAEKLQIQYIDSGAFYRAVTYLTIINHIKLNEINKIIEITKNCNLSWEGEDIYMNKVNMTKEMRSLEVSNRVSTIAKIKSVREIITEKLRKYKELGSLVMDGKDIGTVVFPDADFKFFLTSDINVRAARRQQDLQDYGYQVQLDKIINEITKRDEMDINREESPLQKAPDAIEVDTTYMIIEEQVDFLYKSILQKINLGTINK
ncbi:MAG: (d)CMP kinase [Ignavibacteria bacterium]|nr:(d)CMP kinase [Ignavibacteria bacterium]